MIITIILKPLNYPYYSSMCSVCVDMYVDIYMDMCIDMYVDMYMALMWLCTCTVLCRGQWELFLSFATFSLWIELRSSCLVVFLPAEPSPGPNNDLF